MYHYWCLYMVGGMMLRCYKWVELSFVALLIKQYLLQSKHGSILLDMSKIE